MKYESDRLSYERITRHHAVDLRAVLCDPVVYEYIDEREAPSAEELLAAFIRKEGGAPPERGDETWIDLAVLLTRTGEAIGRVEATVIERRAEVAYLLGRAHWGFGFAREAVQWLQQLLAEDYGVRDLWATVMRGNQRSIALLERLGYAEAPQSCWPDVLTSFNEGDRVFHLSCGQHRDMA